LDDISIDERMILKFIIGTLNGSGYEPEWCVSGLGYEVGSCECNDTHSGPIKCGETLDWLRDY
jgi:hypothetical protein